MPKAHGESHPSAVMTEAEVAMARLLNIDPGLCTGCLARMYKVHYQTMWKILNYKTWTHEDDTRRQSKKSSQKTI